MKNKSEKLNFLSKGRFNFIAFAKSLFYYPVRVSRNFLSSAIDISRLELFVYDPHNAVSLVPRPDLIIKKLSRENLDTLTHGQGRFSEQARLYYVNRGIESAYGAFKDGELVHMSWVYTADEYSKEPIRRLMLNEDEVEIVNCFTLNRLRGNGIYPYTILFLSNLLIQNGIKRVYMMAERKNFASQKGILKAGLKHIGKVIYIYIPALSSKPLYYKRIFLN